MKTLQRLALVYVAHPLARAWWLLRRPRTQGVKCLIERDGQYLFIRHSYGSRNWSLPGGGLKRGETPEAAIYREVEEEVGLQITTLRYLGNFAHIIEHKRDTVFCYHAYADAGAVCIDDVEIIEAAWHAAAAPPPNRSDVTNRVLDLHQRSDASRESFSRE